MLWTLEQYCGKTDDVISSEVADEHNVPSDGAARQGQLFAIARPVEPEYMIGLEIGQLHGLAAVERLAPYIQ